MKQALIIDTKAGNLFSLRAAVQRLGYEVTIASQPSDIRFDAVIIPGQGRFGTVMENITQAGWPEYLRKARAEKTPMLGVCVGMQIFFEASEEDPEAEGLGWFKGRARALDFPKKPMVGWANIESTIWPQACVYFVNSYAIDSAKESIATTFYGEEFCAAVRQGCFTGVQFHPEKSSEAGARIIEDALNNRGEE